MLRTCLCFLLSLALLTAADFPAAELSNGEIKVAIYLPDAKTGFYRGTRFDWAGMISSVTYKGHVFYGQWFARVDPAVRDVSLEGSDVLASPSTAAVGPAEEFVTDANQPLGYEEAKTGGTFVKIGVGVLRKPDDSPYNRFKLYELVDGGKWDVKKSAASIEFTQTVNDAGSGFGYVYSKTIRLESGKPALSIEHRLRNIGQKAIDTNVYNHNFLRIDGQGPGPDYVISAPYAIQSSRPPNKELAEIRGNSIVYLKALEKQERVATPMAGFGGRPSDYDLRVENRKAGVGVRITGDRPPQSVAMWSVRAVLAVEPFVKVQVAPQAEFTWAMKYEYYPVSAPMASTLPEGPGKAEFEKICVTCHDAGRAIDRKRTPQEWARVVDDMVARGASGNDAQFDAITAWLSKNYAK